MVHRTSQQDTVHCCTSIQSPTHGIEESHAQVYAGYRLDRKQVCRKEARGLVDIKLNTSQQCALVLHKANSTLVGVNKSLSCRLKEVITLLHLT